MKKVSINHFSGDAVDLAKFLLGKLIEYKGHKAMIVETEAYKDDQASHANKITPRGEIMYSTHGHVYVYLIYGMYHCLNFTTNKGERGAVLIRALEPLEGLEEMHKRRKTDKIHNLCSGPGKLCQALNITKEINSTKIHDKLKLYHYKEIPEEDIHATTRIGITKALELPWRFYIKKNKFISKS